MSWCDAVAKKEDVENVHKACVLLQILENVVNIVSYSYLLLIIMKE